MTRPGSFTMSSIFRMREHRFAGSGERASCVKAMNALPRLSRIRDFGFRAATIRNNVQALLHFHYHQTLRRQVDVDLIAGNRLLLRRAQHSCAAEILYLLARRIFWTAHLTIGIQK